MEPISNYYLSSKGFILKPKWPSRLKATFIALIIGCSLAYTGNSSSYSLPSYKLPTVPGIYQNYITSANPKVPTVEVVQIVTSTLKWAKEFEIDERLLLAIAKVESTFNKYAISKSGAYGLMQVIPVWHKDKIIEAKLKLGNPEVFNIDTNIYLGARVLKDCLNNTGDTSKALSCYSGKTPGYDKLVLQEYKSLKEL